MECLTCFREVVVSLQEGRTIQIDPLTYEAHRCEFPVDGRVCECVCGVIVFVLPSGERRDWPENTPHKPHDRAALTPGRRNVATPQSHKAERVASAAQHRQRAKGIEL